MRTEHARQVQRLKRRASKQGEPLRQHMRRTAADPTDALTTTAAKWLANKGAS